jgi:hypothetical protein
MCVAVPFMQHREVSQQTIEHILPSASMRTSQENIRNTVVAHFAPSYGPICSVEAVSVDARCLIKSDIVAFGAAVGIVKCIPKSDSGRELPTKDTYQKCSVVANDVYCNSQATIRNRGSKTDAWPDAASLRMYTIHVNLA